MSTLLFKHVNVVDVRNQQILSDVDVWIKNERIEKIGRDIKSSADQVVDGEGKYLSPGIIDCMYIVHGTEALFQKIWMKCTVHIKLF